MYELLNVENIYKDKSKYIKQIYENKLCILDILNSTFKEICILPEKYIYLYDVDIVNGNNFTYPQGIIKNINSNKLIKYFQTQIIEKYILNPDINLIYEDYGWDDLTFYDISKNDVYIMDDYIITNDVILNFKFDFLNINRIYKLKKIK